MKQDLKLGLLLTLVASVVLAPRFLPEFEFSGFVENEQKAEAAQTQESEPSVAEAAPPKSKTEPVRKDVTRPTESASALSTVFPEGFHDAWERDPQSGKRSLDAEKKSKKSPTPESDDKAPVSSGKTFMVEKESNSKAKTANQADALPGLPALFDDDDETAVADTTVSSDDLAVSVDDAALPGLTFAGLSLDADEDDKDDQQTGDSGSVSKSSEEDEKPIVFVGGAVGGEPEPSNDETTDESAQKPKSQSKPSADSASKISERAKTDASKQTDVSVRSFEVKRDRKDKSAGSQRSVKKPPVHPFFQRYLDAKRYFVREGDTLEDIAHRLYQDASYADRLWELNRETLSRPDDLRPGMTLILP